ncbi:MAG: NAD(P)-dependent oxidoreductase, partial [Candidatus Thermoplasmatota archaeon]|nr:NAD(P)-dependent oxidoreductase [Candidatus Thermoplasmatota archaeon]
TGRIGGEVARHVLQLGGQVVAYDLVHDPALANLDGFTYASSLERMAAQADVLTVHVPLTEATRNLIDAGLLSKLPTGACLVNTARGDIVDQGAVAAALQEGTLAAYHADVLPGEPEPPDLARFQQREDVLFTPHLAAYDDATLQVRYERTARIIQAVLEGRPEAVASFRLGGEGKVEEER